VTDIVPKGTLNPDLLLTLDAGSSMVEIGLVESSATAPSPSGVRAGRQAAFIATLIWENPNWATKW
jgi:hypothetical protein